MFGSPRHVPPARTDGKTAAMGTWAGIVVETGGHSTFWQIARKLGIKPLVERVPKKVGLAFEDAFALAEKVSLTLQSTVVALAVETSPDVVELRVFSSGTRVRRLAFSGEGPPPAGDERWVADEGATQEWEKAYLTEPGEPAQRACAALEVQPAEVAGVYKRPSLWLRLMHSIMPGI
jgi:hypothetical protein